MISPLSVIQIIADRDAQIAQLVEQRTENPRVVGSIPTLGTNRKLRFVLDKFYRIGYNLTCCAGEILQDRRRSGGIGRRARFRSVW